MQEHSRMYETIERWDNIARRPRKSHKMTPQQRQAQFENQWNVVQTMSGGINTTPTRQHRELGQAHRARMNYQTVLRATACQAGKFLYASTTSTKYFLLLSARTRILRLEREV